MAKTRGPKAGSSKNKKGPSTINAIKTFKDTLQEGGVDEFMHQRDKILLGDDEAPAQANSDDEDYITDRGQEVFGLNLPEQDAEADYDEDEYEEEEEAPVKKGRKQKVKLDVTGKGRYGKSDSEDDDEAASSDDPDAESWGRSYYSRPSTRRGRDMEDDGYGSEEERKEEERMLEEKEVKRLQRKMRSGIEGDADWGLDELDENVQEKSADVPVSATSTRKSLPTTTESLPSTTPTSELLTHLKFKEPVKLALARDFPLMVKKLEKTERGINRLKQEKQEKEKEAEAKKGKGKGKKGRKEKESNEKLHEGLAWLHYQVLLSYVTTLAFYLHLASLPSDKRPDFNTHPILVRLLQLKEAVNAMEEAEFSAGSVNEDEKIQLFQRIKDIEDDDDDDDDEEMTEAQKEMLAKYMAGGMGDIDWDDAQDLWEGGSLEDGELDELQADASLDMGSEDDVDDDEEEDDDEEMEDDEDEEMEDFDDLDDLEDLEESDEEPAEVKPSKKGKEKKSKNKPSTLEEPEFVPASKSKKSGANKSIFEEEDMGDLTALSASEQAERTAKKRSLRFHTSKIAATSARRSAAREARLQGDEDVPYKNRQAARDAALQRNSARGAAGEDLDGEEWSEKDKKRAREAMDTEEDGEDYYETVKRRRTDEKDAKQQAHDDAREEERRALMEPESADGPRSLTRAIEKNRGLTPRRAKANRNPRVKKRENYEKAKRKVKSMRAVYSGGQSALGGSYQGEKTGISTTSKSRRF